MPISTTGRASIGTSQVAATAVTGWGASTPCGFGVLVSIPAANTGIVYYGFATGVTTSNGVAIPNGVPYTINPAGLCVGTPTPSLSNLFFISDTAAQTFTAEAIG